MASIGTLKCKDFRGVKAKVEYDGNQLKVYTKSGWARVFGGVVGEALASYKERFFINVDDIKELKFETSALGHKMINIFTRYEEFTFTLNHDDISYALKYDLEKRGVSIRE